MRYPLSVTPYYLSLINPDDTDDPIRKQAVPSALEMTMGTIGMEDPLAEKEDSVVLGLVHRYPDRALMVLTDICPMLIISGGDPLTLSTSHLESIISKVRKIKHIEIIRIGTRFPVVLPQRIDNELCAMLSKYSPIWLNTHFNHPHEITPEAAEACDRLLRSGVPVNNQSVLLRGVNDTVETMLRLCQGLLRIKVRPYYLFQCDEVQGTEHLRTPVETGVKIIEGMRGYTSGLAVPTFVVDLPQGGGKVPLQPNYVLAQTENELVLRNYQNRIFHYRNPDQRGCMEEAKVITGPSVNAISGLLGNRKLKLKNSKGTVDADRVVVRS